MKKNKITLIILLSCISLFFGGKSYANINSVFSGAMATFNDAGTYAAGGRKGFSGGSGVIKFPHKSIQLMSLTPPTFSAGCNGISWSLGGFSFIDGEELMAFIQSAGNGALGQIVLLASKVICAPCAGTIETVQGWSSFMANMATDSCTAGKNLVNWGASKAMTHFIEECKSTKMNTNSFQDFYASQKSNECSENKGRGWIAEGLVNAMEDEGWATQVAETKAVTSPVPLWNYMRDNKIIPQVSDGTKLSSLSDDKIQQLGMAEIIMSIYIPIIKRDMSKESKLSLDKDKIKTLLDYVMCGTGLDKTLSDSGKLMHNTACQGRWGAIKEFTIATCGGPTSGEINGETCNLDGLKTGMGDDLTFKFVKLRKEYKNQWAGGMFLNKGIYSMVYKAFDKAFENIKNDKSPDDKNDLLKNIVNFVPFDVYRIFNIASVEPKAAERLAHEMSFFISYSFINNFFESTLGQMKKLKKSDKGVMLDSTTKYFQGILSEISSEISDISKYKNSTAAQGMKYQKLFMSVIEAIEADVRQQVSAKTIYKGSKFKTSTKTAKDGNKVENK